MDRVAKQDGKKKPEMKKIGETYRPGTIVDNEYEKAKKNKSK